MGIHLYKAAGGVSNNTIRNNYIHHNASRGILLGSGSNNLARDNLLVANGFANKAGGLGITSGGGGTNNQAYNNRLYANFGCINIGSGYKSSKITGNLCLSNRYNTITNSGTGTVLANNVISTDPTLVKSAVPSLSSQPNDSVAVDANPAAEQGEVDSPSSDPTTIPNAPINLQLTP
jgi:parallel beta-helix repeat protein